MVPSTPFQSYGEVYDWLTGFVNFERGQSQEFRLDRMKALAELAGRPENCAPSFHVAGSKGKGSVTGMLASILEEAGMKTARYTSPHVSDFRERLSLGGNFFPDDIYIRSGRELKALVDRLKDSCRLDAGLFDLNTGEDPTFFELMTLWFFLCARLAHSDIMAVETGLGGRLDATNILDPLVSIITLIEKEHTEILGNTIAAIAGEKAGIIKQGRPLVLAEQTDEALEVFKKAAAQKESPLFYFPDCAELRDVRVSRQGTIFTLVLKKNELMRPGNEEQIFSDLSVAIPGEVQAKNAGLAVLALKAAFPDISEAHIRKGLAGFTLPARFELISETPPVIIDGAHTKHSMDTCLGTFVSLYGSGGILIFGCVAGKDVHSMAALCVPHFSRIIITTPGTFKKSFPEEIYDIFYRELQKSKSGPELIFIPDTGKALEKAINLAAGNGLPILATGSFYLAGELRNRLKGRPHV